MSDQPSKPTGQAKPHKPAAATRPREATAPRPAAAAAPAVTSAPRRLDPREELDVLIRAVRDHLRGELGGGSRRTLPAGDRRTPQEEPVRVDGHARDQQVGRRTAAGQGGSRQHGRSPGRAGRRDPARRAGDLPVQGFPPFQLRRPLQHRRDSPPARPGPPPARHVQDARDRRAQLADCAGPGQGRDRARIRLAGHRRFRPAAGPDHRRRAGQPQGPDRPRSRGPGTAAARRPRLDAERGRERLRQDAGAGRQA